jgi:hypothetical protein
MPDQPFTVHVDPDTLARLDLAAVVPPLPSGVPAPVSTGESTGQDAKATATSRPERVRPRRAPVAGTRSYAFRRH